ncbi:MAG: helix-turn-helix transcriptional regulator [Sneathiellaceae bacterium]
MTEGLGARLEVVRAHLGLTQQELAARLDVGISTYQRYASGPSASIKPEQLDVLANLGVDLNWLVTGRGTPPISGSAAAAAAALAEAIPNPEPMLRQMLGAPAPPRRGAPDEPEVPEGFVLVPRYDLEASAGHGALTDGEHVLDYMAFQEAWVRRSLRVDPNRLALITATGDSMEPAIRSGDLLLIDCSVETIMDDSIYLVSLSDFLLVKRVQKMLRGVIVSSDNPSYKPITLNAEEAAELHVRGRVRWIGRLI